jgi:hypothetical protein
LVGGLDDGGGHFVTSRVAAVHQFQLSVRPGLSELPRGVEQSSEIESPVYEAGLTLGGGLGWLKAKYALGADNLQAGNS